MTPLVSIIIPNYNRAHIINQTLTSIGNQTYQNWECLIVDDGSVDNSNEVIMEFVKKDSRMAVYSRPLSRSKGANACRNYGFEKSKGDFVLWFDSDDVLELDYLETVIQNIKNGAWPDLITCLHQVFHKCPKLIPLSQFQVTVLDVKGIILRKQFLQTGAAVWNRSFLMAMQEVTDLFDEELSQSQDYDFFSRALMRKPNFIQIPRVLYHFRRGSASISDDFISGNINHISSFLTVKRKLSRLNKDNDQIVIGLLNHVLAAYRYSITKDEKIHKLIRNYLSEWRREFNNVSPFRIKTIILLGGFLRALGGGSTRCKKAFIIK